MISRPGAGAGPGGGPAQRRQPGGWMGMGGPPPPKLSNPRKTLRQLLGRHQPGGGHQRLVLRLPQGSDHELVGRALIDLRDVYVAITAPSAPTPERIQLARSQVAGIVAMMQEVRTRNDIAP